MHLRTCDVCREKEAALADSRQALGSLEVPALSASEVDRILEAAMPAAPTSSAPSRGSWWSHAAAVMVGVALMAGGRGCQAKGSLDRPEPVERIVEVRVEVPVENPEGNPADTPLGKPAEKIVYRDRHVMHALQPRWDAQLRAASALSDAALLTARWVDRAYTNWERRTPKQGPVLPNEPPKPSATPISLAAASPGKERTAGRVRAGKTHLEVRRMDGRVKLRTRGSLAQVVPVLIDTLDSDDPAVVAAAVDRLESIRAGFGARAVELRPEPARPVRRSNTLRALLSSRGRAVRASEMDDADLWRGWWQRQRTQEERAGAAASI